MIPKDYVGRWYKKIENKEVALDIMSEDDVDIAQNIAYDDGGNEHQLADFGMLIYRKAEAELPQVQIGGMQGMSTVKTTPAAQGTAPDQFVLEAQQQKIDLSNPAVNMLQNAIQLSKDNNDKYTVKVELDLELDFNLASISTLASTFGVSTDVVANVVMSHIDNQTMFDAVSIKVQDQINKTS